MKLQITNGVGGALKAKLGGEAGIQAAVQAAQQQQAQFYSSSTQQQQAEALQAQQNLADQMAAKLEQQQAMDRQEYRLRPKSASQNRASGSGSAQRPLSAFAGRR